MRRRRPVGRRRRGPGAPWPIVLLLLALLIPYEASQFVGPLRISAYRAVLLVIVPWCLLLIVNRRRGPWLLSDTLMLGSALWAMMTILVHHGFEQAIESGGVYVLEGFGGYVIARCFIRNLRTFRATVALLTTIIIVLLLVTLPEMLSGRHFVHDVARSIFGGDPVLDKATRLGLHRAYGPFPHPILYGVFCAACFGLAWYGLAGLGLMRRTWRVVLIAVATLASLSTGPLFALGAQACVIGWDVVTRRIRRRWLLLAGTLVVAYVTVDVLSNRTPVEVLLTRLAFNPVTGYGRLQIWTHGLDNIAAHPWLGIGLRDWSDAAWMGRSIDNFWIYTGVKFGLPALFLLIGAILAVAVPLVGLRLRHRPLHHVRMAWLTSMTGLCLAGFGVHYWDELFVVFCLLVGSVGWMIEGRPRAVHRSHRPRRSRRLAPAGRSSPRWRRPRPGRARLA